MPERSTPRVSDLTVEVLAVPGIVPESVRVKEALVVIVDVLRASTTIVTALGAGARAVVPVATPDAGRRLRDSDPSLLLGGERGGTTIGGFDLGNSPLEYTPQRVHDRVICMTTTNGVPLAVSMSASQCLLWGSLRNARAVASAAVRARSPVVLACAGTDGRMAIEDVLGAGAIVAALSSMRGGAITLGSDSTRIALELFRLMKDTLHDTLLESTHGKTLRALGFSEDIAFAAELDAETSVVPIMEKDRVVRL